MAGSAGDREGDGELSDKGASALCGRPQRLRESIAAREPFVLDLAGTGCEIDPLGIHIDRQPIAEIGFSQPQRLLLLLRQLDPGPFGKQCGPGVLEGSRSALLAAEFERSDSGIVGNAGTSKRNGLGDVGRNERQAAVAAKIPPMVQAPSLKTRNALPLPELILLAPR
jgi:hypothetical protein